MDGREERKGETALLPSSWWIEMVRAEQRRQERCEGRKMRKASGASPGWCLGDECPGVSSGKMGHV